MSNINTGSGGMGGTSGGGGVGTMSGSRGSMGSAGGSMEGRGGGGSISFSNKSFAAHRPGGEGFKSASIGKPDRIGLNLKNGTESSTKFARSQSLQFKADGDKPLINLNQGKDSKNLNRTEFNRRMVKPENKGFDKPTQENKPTPNNLNKLKFNTANSEIYKTNYNSEIKQANERILKSRTEVPGYKFDSQKAWAKRSEIKQAALQALKTNNEPMIKTYTRPVEKTRVETVSKSKIESSMRARIDHALKRAISKFSKTETKNAIQTIKDIGTKTDVKTQPQISVLTKEAIKTQVSHAVKTEVLNEAKIQTSTQTEVKPSTQTVALQSAQTEVKSENRTQVATATQTEVKPQTQTITLPSTQTEVKIQSQQATSTKTESSVSPSTKTQIELMTKTQIENLVKTQVQQKSQTELQKAQEIKNKSAVVIEELSEKKKDKKEEDEQKINPKYAYFEVDSKTNNKRMQEVAKAYSKAKFEASQNGRKVNGQDIARHMDEIRMKKTESRSIDKIEDDNSAKLYTGYIANIGEITSIKDVIKASENAKETYTATNLTIAPTEQVVGKKEALTVHNGKQEFDAWMDGRLVKVKMYNDTVEA